MTTHQTWILYEGRAGFGARIPPCFESTAGACRQGGFSVSSPEQAEAIAGFDMLCVN